MEKKRQQLEKLDAKSAKVREHQYRYHANLGTFLVHRWVRQGRDRGRIEEVKRSRDEIAEALKINPDAHFGREKYQLKAIEWIIDPPRAGDSPYRLHNLLGWDETRHDTPDPKTADDAVRGLAGLVVLGNAWESVDIFHALIVALGHDTLGFQNAADEGGGRNTLAYLAWLRCRELIDGGKRSMLPDEPSGQGLTERLSRPGNVEAEGLLDRAFVKLRAEADAWQAARTAFMMKRLNEGRHPDTDLEFWNGYTEKPAPGLPAMSVKEHFQELMADRRRLGLVVAIALPVLALAFVVGIRTARWAMARRGRRRKFRSSPEARCLMLRGFLAPTGAMVNSQGLPAPGPRSDSGPRGWKPLSLTSFFC